MMQEIKGTLKKQLELLSERSKETKGLPSSELLNISTAMGRIADSLMALERNFPEDGGKKRKGQAWSIFVKGAISRENEQMATDIKKHNDEVKKHNDKVIADHIKRLEEETARANQESASGNFSCIDIAQIIINATKRFSEFAAEKQTDESGMRNPEAAEIKYINGNFYVSRHGIKIDGRNYVFDGYFSYIGRHVWIENGNVYSGKEPVGRLKPE